MDTQVEKLFYVASKSGIGKFDVLRYLTEKGIVGHEEIRKARDFFTKESKIEIRRTIKNFPFEKFQEVKEPAFFFGFMQDYNIGYQEPVYIEELILKHKIYKFDYVPKMEHVKFISKTEFSDNKYLCGFFIKEKETERNGFPTLIDWIISENNYDFAALEEITHFNQRLRFKGLSCNKSYKLLDQGFYPIDFIANDFSDFDSVEHFPKYFDIPFDLKLFYNKIKMYEFNLFLLDPR